IAGRVVPSDGAESIKPGLTAALRDLPVRAPAGNGIVKAFVDRAHGDSSALGRSVVESILRVDAGIGGIVARRNVNPRIAACWKTVGIVLLQALLPAEEQHGIRWYGHARPINVVATYTEHEDRQLVAHLHVRG